MLKRGFDITASMVALVLLCPLLLLLGLLIKCDSSGPALFKQQRMGRGFRPFWIYKFRTMIHAADGPLVTAGQDSRVTRVGRFLRKMKLDELPQLINVLKGEMSLVGPRPEVPQYVRVFQKDYEEILKARPGITDLASLKYRNEEAILGNSEDPEDDYINRVLPDKITLAKEYLQRSSFIFDLAVIAKTLLRLVDHKDRDKSCAA